MFLSTLTIEGYKNFQTAINVEFTGGLNVLVGENGTGKSTIIDAIRLLLLEDEFGRSGVVDDDFNRPFAKNASPADSIHISSVFSGLSKEEKVAFLPWTELGDEARLTLHVDNKQNNRGRYKRALWGGASKASMFEWELFDRINCIYLPPLRDAESKLKEGRGSRLARLLRNLNRQALAAGEEHPLERQVREFNDNLAGDASQAIAQANQLIRTRLEEALGSIFGQDTLIQFSQVNFNRIVEGLRLLFFPVLRKGTATEMFRGLEQNSLGYNNLLYLASVLAELTNEGDEQSYLRVLLIEEPEAHLHPQLQVRLLRYLEETAKKQGIQIIVSTHSPVLSASVSLDTMIHLSVDREATTNVTPIRTCGLRKESKSYLGRWLDVTKSNLLFAKSVILVEGIAEALLLPELSSRVLLEYNAKTAKQKQLPESLDDCGVAVVNMNGIYFKHFMQLFCNLEGGEHCSLPVLCAGLTDQDPPKTEKLADDRENLVKPTHADKMKGTNKALELIPTINTSVWTRLFAGELKTFEYDLGMTGGNLNIMLEVAAELRGDQPKVAAELGKQQETDWADEEDEDRKASASYYLLRHIDKGEFAQALACKIARTNISFDVPDYIRKAVLWACGGVDV